MDKFLEGGNIFNDLSNWIALVFPKKKKKYLPPREEPLRRSRGARRKKEYAIMQSRFSRNMCSAAHEILDGKIESKMPSNGNNVRILAACIY